MVKLTNRATLSLHAASTATFTLVKILFWINIPNSRCDSQDREVSLTPRGVKTLTISATQPGCLCCTPEAHWCKSRQVVTWLCKHLDSIHTCKHTRTQTHTCKSMINELPLMQMTVNSNLPTHTHQICMRSWKGPLVRLPYYNEACWGSGRRCEWRTRWGDSSLR